MACTTLKTYYIEADLQTDETCDSEDPVLAALKGLKLEKFLSRIEYALVRRQTSQIPAFKVPVYRSDTEQNSTALSRDTKPKPIHVDDIFDPPETSAVEIYAVLAKPLCFDGVRCCVALTEKTADALLHEFLRSRPLYALGRPCVHVLDSTLKALSFSVFTEAVFPEQDLLHDSLLRTLVKKPQPVLPAMLTRGVLTLCCWLKTAFSALNPPALRPERSYAYIWVGESRIGKTLLSQHLLASEAEYHRGGIHWDSYVGSALQIYDDFATEDKTICDNVKTLFNTCDKGTVRRPYGYTQIEHSAVLVLLNAESFRKFKEVMSLSCMSSWLADNTLLYPFENSWDPDSDIVSDCDVVYGVGAKTEYGPGLVRAATPEGPVVSARVSTQDIEHALCRLFCSIPDAFEQRRATLESKGCTAVCAEQLVPTQSDIVQIVHKMWKLFGVEAQDHGEEIARGITPERNSLSISRSPSESELSEFSSDGDESASMYGDESESEDPRLEPRKHRLFWEGPEAKRAIA